MKLDRRIPLSQNHQRIGTCKICSAVCRFFDVVDINKSCSQKKYMYGLAGVPIYYQRCNNCQFIFTTFFDDWTKEEFSAHIYNDEYIMIDGDYEVRRPRRKAEQLAAYLGARRPAILDYGAGSGGFTRELNTYGIKSVVGFDPFSSPTRPDGKYDLITCIEVMEHTPTPLDTLNDMVSFLAPAGEILFTTLLQIPAIEQERGSWWYIAPRNGHLSIYSQKALTLLGEKHGLSFSTMPNFHKYSRA